MPTSRMRGSAGGSLDALASKRQSTVTFSSCCDKSRVDTAKRNPTIATGAKRGTSGLRDEEFLLIMHNSALRV